MKAQERQLSVVACLLNYRYGRTLEQITRDIPAYGQGEAARKKFQRDRRLLDELGVPIHTEVLEGEDPSGNLQYVYRIHHKEIFARRLEFSPAEVRALSWLGQQLQSLGSFPFQDILENVLDKLKSAGGQQGLGDSVRILPYKRSDRENAVLEKLGEAVLQKVKCTTKYQRPQGELQDRVIHPYGLKFLYGHWYLLAWCELRKAVREFRVSRFQAIELSVDSFTSDQEAILKNWFSDESWELGLGDGPEACVDFDPGVAHLARRRLGRKAEFEQRGKQLRARVRVERPGQFLEWLLGWGARAQLIEPTELKQDLLQKLRAAEELYTTSAGEAQ